MTAPRAREQADPPSPPDRLPPRRGGSPSSKTYSAAARPAGLARLAGARRGLVRSARVLAAAALLALTGALALPATAQADVLVSNLDKSSSLAEGVLSSQSLAQGFRTGDDSSGYTVSSVQVKLGLAITPAVGSNLTVTLQTSSRSVPSGTVLAPLINPSSYPAGTVTFNADGNVRLEEGTNYFVVFEYPTFLSSGWPALATTTSDGEDNVGDSEWSIRNAFHEIDPTDSSSAWRPEFESNAILIRVNGVSGVVDLVAPRLTSARVGSDGATVRVIFDEDLSDELPPISAFTITAGGSPVPFSNIDLRSSNSLDLYNPSHLIGQGETVTVEYTDPTTRDDANAIQDTAGNDASSFVDRDVSNLSTVTLPKLSAAAVPADGATVALTFSADLDFPTAFSSVIRNAFTVTVDGTERPTTDFAVSGAIATLTMSDPIGGGQTVIVSYDRSDAGSEAFGSSSTRLVADFTTGENSVPAVVNNAEGDRSPPELTGATVTSSGVAIELAFDEDLDLPGTIPAALKDAFSVTADGDTVEISSLAKDGSSGLQINLSSKILKDLAVVVSYDQSAAGTNALDDAGGNEVVDFTTGSGTIPAVDNNSAVAPATITEVAVTSTPRAATDTYGAGERIEVTVTFSEAVTATTGTDFVLSVAGAKRAPLVRGSGTATLVFGYTVLAADADDNGIWIGDQSRTLVGNRNSNPQNGTITSVPTGTAADLTHSQLGQQSGHKVNGSLTPPPPETPTLSSATAGFGGDRIALDFSENLDRSAGATPPASAFSVSADGASIVVGSVAIVTAAQVQLLSLDRLIYRGQTVTVTYTDPTSGDDAAAIQDAAGNDADSFTTGEDGVPAVTNDSSAVGAAPAAPTALTATAFGATAIDLAWTAPDNNGGSAITGYKIEVSTDGSTGSWSDRVADTESTNTDYRHSGLSSGNTRHYRVSAINVNGTSPASAPDSATTGTAAHHAVPVPIHGTVLWSATMTAEALNTLIGYRSSKEGRPFGALTLTTFDRGDGTPVTVDALYYWSRTDELKFLGSTGLGAGRFQPASRPGYRRDRRPRERCRSGHQHFQSRLVARRHGRRAHGAGHRAGHADRADGDGERHADRPRLDRVGVGRRARGDRLQDRGLRGRQRGELERPRRRHQHRRHPLFTYRAGGRRHAALPGVGDQRRGHVGALRRRHRRNRHADHRSRRTRRRSPMWR